MSILSTKIKLIAAIEACTALRRARIAGRIGEAEFERRIVLLQAIADDYRAAYARKAA